MLIAVVGSGVMGRGIAQIHALAGHEVLLHDARPEAIQAAREHLGAMLERLVDKGRLTQEHAQSCLSRVHACPSIAGLADVELVIEAIAEDLPAKRALFTRLEDVVGEDTILATNTSSLSVTAIASACRLPNRVVGLHYFNPVPLMKVVEVVRGMRSDPAIIERLCELSTQVGHRAVVAADTPGFIVNHAGRGYTTEALRIIAEGVAEHAEVDRILREQVQFEGRGFPMGPFELLDLTGLDVSHPVMLSIFEQFYGEPRFRPSPLAAQRVAAGLFGRKSGEGFYPYQGGRRSTEDAGEPAPAALPPVRVWVAPGEACESLRATADALGALVSTGAAPGEQDIILLAPLGHDLSTACVGFDPTRCVAIDTLFPFEHKSCRRRVLMRSPATDPAISQSVASLFAADGARISMLRDSAGFVAQRVIAMIVAIGCEIAQQRIASAADVDEAVRIGLGYPLGPIAMGDALGPARIDRLLANIHAVTDDPRYRPSLWVRRRAALGLSLFQED
ncbi:MAG: 3-hydroxyacyl-CoA dehydrogenase [Burkholderiaceae bacterium]